jgi:hypothetical protein
MMAPVMKEMIVPILMEIPHLTHWVAQTLTVTDGPTLPVVFPVGLRMLFQVMELNGWIMITMDLEKAQKAFSQIRA